MWLFTFEITSGQLSSQNKPLTEQLRLFSHDLKTEKSPFVFLREVCHMNSIAQQQEWAFDWLALSCNLPGLSGTGRTRLSTQTSRTNTYRDVQNCDPHLKQHVPFSLQGWVILTWWQFRGVSWCGSISVCVYVCRCGVKKSFISAFQEILNRFKFLLLFSFQLQSPLKEHHHQTV